MRARPDDSVAPRVALDRGEVLHHGERTRLVRRPLVDGTGTVICKEMLGPDAAQRLRYERQILERLVDIPGVPRLMSVACPANVIVFEDTAASPLSERLHTTRPAVDAQLHLALELTHLLGALHRRGVTHGSINPANILLCGAGCDPMLIDFGRATACAEQRPGFGHHNAIEGALAYLAPEQTGRTGRPVDQRADLYGLGATLYHLATGEPPFDSADPLLLVREILTRTPTPPVEYGAQALPGLSDIIMRLLEKEPGRRYQSAEGLAHDLRRLREDHARGGTGRFPLGENDFPLRLSAPSRLIGRRTEIEALERALTQALRGGCRGVLVSGAPGIGKTALINELRPMVTARGGWFVAGKFDQHRRDLASDAVYQALRALGGLLLTEPESDLLRLRERLLAALGPNVDLVASIQPEIALVLGVEPRRLPGDPLSLEGRLIRGTIDVLSTVASPAHPVVLALDDLQWATPPPIGLLDAVFRGDAIPGLLVVGAFRDAEIDVTHPLASLLTSWQRLPEPPTLLRPENLPPADLGVMLTEMLRLEPREAAPLADAIGAHSGGNPFDTVELINALRNDGALVRGATGWRWDAETIRRYAGEGDVVDLLVTRIDNLPPKTAALLERMACLGGETDPGLLQVAAAVSPAELEERLLPALEDGLLVMEHGGPGAGVRTVRFRHDRVQQAAFRRLSAVALRDVRLGLARSLESRPEYTALAADQYLPVVGSLDDPAERRRVVRLLQDGANMSRLTNHVAAERFLAAALTLLSTDYGPADRRLLVALETGHHAALYSLGRLEEADLVYDSVERHCTDALELADAACTQVSSLTNRDRPQDAVALGLDMLRRLGVAVPEDEQIDHETARGLARFKRWVADGDLAGDLQRPEASDPHAMAAARLINRMIPPAFFVGLPIMPWLMLECQRLWVTHGPCAAMIGPMSHAGFVSVMLGQDYRAGYTAVRRALAVSESRGYEPESSQALTLLCLSAGQWFEPLETVVARAQRAHSGLVRGGDLQNAGFAFYALIPTSLECTPTLEGYLAHVEAGLAFTGRTGNDQTGNAMIGYRQLVRALRGETDGPGLLTDASFDTGTQAAILDADAVASVYTHIANGIASVLFGNVADLIRHAAGAMSLMLYIDSTLSSAITYLLQALATAERVRAAVGTERTRALAELDRYRGWLALRAADAPGNFAHLLRLVDAERAWALDDFHGAVVAFDAALSTVRPRERPWHGALIAERAALCHLSYGLAHTGRSLMVEARRRYESWGATGKVRQLDRAHAFLHAGDDRLHGCELAPVHTVTAESIDLLAILRASQVLSSETSMERLQSRVTDILSAMTGATSVRVVLRRDDPDGWFVPVSDDAGGTELPVDEAARRRLLPRSALRYVERTREPLLVDDAARDDRFAHDPYLRTRDRSSLLIVPILSHGVPRAMLVLENCLTSGAFSDARLDAVRLLAGQLAVSLENAMIYEELERRVRQRTREVRDMQSQLVDTARHVGMAEIATNVLHNVGNVLNSVNISADLLTSKVRGSKLENLPLVTELMAEHAMDLGDFLTRDGQGRLLPEYLTRLAQVLVAEQREVVTELGRLTRNIDHIKDIVATQQSYAGSTSVAEPTYLVELVEDALRMNAEALRRHHVSVVNDLTEAPPILLDRARVLLILVNLIRNARDAMAGLPEHRRRLTLRITTAGDRTVRVRVEDEGEGIAEEHLTWIFAHGFTTRDGGHGFGLHSCALAAREMGGSLTAHSDGPGRGAVFTLDLPVTTGAVVS